jgi:hypothetical protein
MPDNSLAMKMVNTAWMPCSLPPCTSYGNPPEIAFDLGFWFEVIFRRSTVRHGVVTTKRRFRCHLGSAAFFQSA